MIRTFALVMGLVWMIVTAAHPTMAQKKTAPTKSVIGSWKMGTMGGKDAQVLTVKADHTWTNVSSGESFSGTWTAEGDTMILAFKSSGARPQKWTLSPDAKRMSLGKAYSARQSIAFTRSK